MEKKNKKEYKSYENDEEEEEEEPETSEETPKKKETKIPIVLTEEQEIQLLQNRLAEKQASMDKKRFLQTASKRIEDLENLVEEHDKVLLKVLGTQRDLQQNFIDLNKK